MWPIKLLLVLLRNQIILKPKARRAARAVMSDLESRDFAFQSVDVSLGLAEPQELGCNIIFKSDFELERFNLAGLLDPIAKRFRETLQAQGYPHGAASLTRIEVHSKEEIERAGGYYTYFN